VHDVLGHFHSARFQQLAQGSASEMVNVMMRIKTIKG
jgi:hypothetical protein